MYDVALLDLDGVVYVGPSAVPGAADVLRTARESGVRIAFVTNNAARTPGVVADHLTDLGIAARPEEIVTSAQAAARYLAERLAPAARVLVVGTTGLVEALTERGLVPVDDAREPVDAVVQGYSPDMNWRLLAEGAVAINRGVPWIATNDDRTVPSERGPLPGNGSLVAALRHATRKTPTVTGKPDPTMHREMLLRTAAERPLIVGDRLDTDIEGANNVGCPSLLVLSGVTTARDLLTAPPALRPTYLAADVSGLLVEHPALDVSDGAARCGRWLARRADAELSLEANGSDGSADRNRTGSLTGAAAGAERAAPLGDDALDALRALCAAQWDADDDVSTPTAADEESAGMLVRLGLTS